MIKFNKRQIFYNAFKVHWTFKIRRNSNVKYACISLLLCISVGGKIKTVSFAKYNVSNTLSGICMEKTNKSDASLCVIPVQLLRANRFFSNFGVYTYTYKHLSDEEQKTPSSAVFVQSVYI